MKGEQKMFAIIIFFLLNLVNVVLGTLRSFCTIRCNQHIGMAVTTISYTFYAGIVKMISGQPMWIVLLATFITNVIGFYIADFIFKKLSKDKLWKITISVKSDFAKNEIMHKLHEYGIPVYEIKCYDNADWYLLEVYARTQGESAITKEIISPFKVKTAVTQIEKAL